MKCEVLRVHRVWHVMIPSPILAFHPQLRISENETLLQTPILLGPSLLLPGLPHLQRPSVPVAIAPKNIIAEISL